jgi:hypothetical protein
MGLGVHCQGWRAFESSGLGSWKANEAETEASGNGAGANQYRLDGEQDEAHKDNWRYASTAY